MSPTATAGSNPATSDPYRSEVRFGVVMYGGVSLAIYINGVANELYEMACATPKRVIDNDAVTPGTRDVYRKASFLLGSEELRQQYAQYLKTRDPKLDPFKDAGLPATAERVRFVVDVISGTSAGGINGAFLAKALANGQPFSPLKDLWIQEGNIDSLLNDDASYQGLEYAKVDTPPRSLLNSDRMYIKLLDAFEGMQQAASPSGQSGSPLVDELDLYMTTTDIRGSVVPLRLFDDVVYEKRFKQVYHFQYLGPSHNDLKDENAPFLAFAARCTSSFPFAFEPMTVADAQRLCRARTGGGAIDFATWKPFFTGLSGDDMADNLWRRRAFGDGGYLDNKPFSYVVEALSWRLGALPMDRKLLYVEPVPSHPEAERTVFKDKPEAIENAFAALSTIPQYETIREDLEAILARNRRIERVERIVRQVEADVETRSDDPFKRLKLIDGKVPKWSSLDLGAMIDYYGVAFLPYRRLRMAAVTDDIAERLAVWWDVDRRSDRFYALKAMARAWREGHYYENDNPRERKPSQTASVNQFLDDFDLKYRLRRVSFLLRKVHQLRSLAVKLKQGVDEKLMSDIEHRLFTRLLSRERSLKSLNFTQLIAALDCLAGGFGDALQVLRDAVWPAPLEPADQPSATDRAMLDQLLGLLLEPDPRLTELAAAADGTSVPLPKDLPPPSPTRTLQENVFERAKVLFISAQGATLTRLQKMLEDDLDTLRNTYVQVIRTPDDHQSQGQLAGDLLGHPTLEPEQVGTLNPQGESKVRIQIDDTVDFGNGVLNSPEGKILRKFLAEYYLRFDEYDQMSFPLYYDTGTGEPSTVEVLRVSPEDARSLINQRQKQGETADKRRKLAGTALFNFGAFLDEKWRRNDIMWGRLDGCERLLAALFPEPKDDAIRQALLQEAQRSILQEEMQPDGYAELLDGFAKALAAQKEETLDAAFDGLWAKLAPPDDEQRRTRMALALKAILGDDGLFEYVHRYYEVNRKFDTAASLKTGARALTITGRILEGSEKYYRGAEPSRMGMIWVTRGGRALQVLLTISTPGGLPNAVFRHWLAMLYFFEALIVVGAIAFSAPAARTFGLTCLVITLALHLISLVTGDLMYRKWGRLALIAALFAVGVLAMASLGALAWSNGTIGSIMCAGGNDRPWVLRELCGS
jgi:patatin-related protein